jgi:hypothetical protein
MGRLHETRIFCQSFGRPTQSFGRPTQSFGRPTMQNMSDDTKSVGQQKIEARQFCVVRQILCRTTQ